jgi:parallel beta-helix repeat protein
LNGENGIRVSASDVTIDLNGFRILGRSNDLSGISIDAGLKNITIRNGHISGFGFDGINADGVNCGLYENLCLENNLDDGLEIGSDSVIRNCRAVGNGDMGFIGNSGITITESVAQGNGDDGISMSTACVISRCVSRDNEGDGINAATACTIDHCSVLNNRNDGIDANQRGNISDCVVMSNGRRASTTGLGVGIRMVFAGMVKHCVVDFNGGTGILLTSPIGGSGGGATHVLENEVTNNANQGVFVQGGGGNRIEGNSFIANSGPAIQNITGGNLVIKNNAIGNFGAGTVDDYDLNAGDTRGPIITGPGVIAAGANPWANFVQ